MQTAGIILSIIIVCFRLYYWKREPHNLEWILAEAGWWVIILFLAGFGFFSCKATQTLQKEPSYEHYQKNESWKTS